MLKIYLVLLFLAISSNTLAWDYEDSFLDDSELVLTFMVFRHGDRAPVEMTLPYVTDRAKVLERIQKSGYGQLTKAGKRRGFKVGSFIRHRYDGFLSSKYNQSEIYIRSTNSSRAKMTVLAAMAAVYPVENSRCEDMECEESNWTPVPYTTESPIYDFNLAVVNCPKFKNAFTDAFNGPAPEMARYYKFLDHWSKIIGVNITQQPSKAYLLYDTYTSQTSLGVPIGPELESIFPEIEKAAAAGIEVVFGNEEYISLGAGVLLKQFLDVADKIISGEEVPKVHVYSAHDCNVYTLMAVTKVRPRLGAPKYGALYALELRRVRKTGQYIVQPIYLETPDKFEVVNLEVEGCGRVCDLRTFIKLVSKYKLELNEWRRQCDWSEDYDFDFRPIA